MTQRFPTSLGTAWSVLSLAGDASAYEALTYSFSVLESTIPFERLILNCVLGDNLTECYDDCECINMW